MAKSAQSDFENFFAKDFSKALDETEIPGMPGSSWDRKAAWLLWVATDSGSKFKPTVVTPDEDDDDLL